MVKVSMGESDFNDGNFFEEGVHKVKIEGAVVDKLDDGREYIDVGIKGEGGEEAEVRLWLHTEGAAKFTIRTLQAIMVHNAKTEADKDKIRTYFIGDFDDKKIAAVASKLDDKECWYSNFKNLDRPYTAADGTTKYSYDRNITGYEPAPKEKTPESVVMDTMGGGEKVEESADEPFPFD